jgi:hypothetical protein
MARDPQEARLGLAQIFARVDPEADPHAVRILGSFYQALLKRRHGAAPDRPAGGPAQHRRDHTKPRVVIHPVISLSAVPSARGVARDGAWQAGCPRPLALQCAVHHSHLTRAYTLWSGSWD